ncbi:MAG: hypothetical protein LBB23_04380 [Rickettsiales bacterium]|jgi:type IV secretion system protein VirB4|nr:hypothetical protein [Rickettsiales bacterium]
MENLINVFTANSDYITLLSVMGGLFTLFILFLLYASVLSKILFPKFGFLRYGNYLPFMNALEDDITITLKNKHYARIYKISGVQLAMQDENKRAQYFDLRSRFLNMAGVDGATLRFFMTRTKDDARTNFEFDEKILQEIHDAWNSQGMKLYKNEHYMVIDAPDISSLSKVSELFENMFAPYNPRVARHSERENFASFYAKILSPVSGHNVLMKNLDISEIVATDSVSFDNGTLVFSSGTGVKYANILSYRTAPDFMDEDFFTSLSAVQSEMVVMNGMKFMSKKAAENLFKRKQVSADDERAFDTLNRQIEETRDRMDEETAGNQNLIDYYPLFMIMSDTKEELKIAAAEFGKICASFGVSSVAENFALKPAFFSLMPGFDMFPRSFAMLTNAASASIPLASVPEGNDNSDWGNGAIAVFPTAEGTPYKFQFHVSNAPAAVAHSLVIGPTGTGKTTLFSFLISQSLRHQKLKTFFFDRNRGAEIFTLGIGGKYITFDSKSENADNIAAGVKASMNPLMMDDSAANRDFLKRWLGIISEANGAAAMDEIAEAVEVVFDYIDKDDRNLKNLVPACFSSQGDVRANMKKWIDDNQYGSVFNAKEDNVDLRSRLTTFDFTNILEDKTLSPAVLSYLLQRVNNITLSGGNPSLVMIDETAPMLENEQFRKNFIIGLQEGRKNRQAYMAAFQRANILDKLGIGDVVRGQAQTILFFRNPAADISDYEHWRLNPMEQAFIQGKLYPNLKRGLLLRRPITGESVILNTELAGLGGYIRLFESGRKNVLLAEEIYKKQGSGFVWEYLRSFGG